MTPSFRLFLATLFIALLAAWLVGCGGGGEEGTKNRQPLNCDIEDCTK